MSTKPLSQKLQIKKGYRILLLNEPENYKNLLGPIPENIEITDSTTGKFDLIQLFVKSQIELEKYLHQMKSLLKSESLVWITYPKESSKIKSDINRDKIYKYASAVNLKGVSMVSIDKTWSAFRFKLI